MTDDDKRQEKWMNIAFEEQKMKEREKIANESEFDK